MSFTRKYNHERGQTVIGVLLALGLVSSAAQGKPRHPNPPHLRNLSLPRMMPAGAATPSDPNAEDLLRRMLVAENNLALSGDQVSTVSRSGLDVSSEQRVLRNGAKALRIEYVRPPRLVGEQIVDNGTTYWHLFANKKLEQRPSQVMRLQVRIPEVMRSIKQGRLLVQWVGQDAVAGHACGVVQVTAAGSTPSPARYWIDMTNGAQLKIERYGPDGQLQSVSYYTDVIYNPPMDPHAFDAPAGANTQAISPASVTPPLSWDQAQRQAGFLLAKPTYLPQGFLFQSAAVSEFGGRKLVSLRYVNGLNVLSLFETPDVGGGSHDGIRRPRHGVLVTWQAGLKLILVGNLSDADMNRIIRALR